MKGILPVLFTVALLQFGSQGATRTATIGGHPQRLHLYGDPAARPVIVSSGDGGWVHLAPHLADWLSAHGYFVVGFDVKAYLTAATEGGHTLTPADIGRDYAALLALFPSTQPPILAGVSEGAGLSLVAAADPATNGHVGGVITFGVGDVNELGWRWKDSIIYVTHGVPNEPTFHAASFIPRVSPAPLAFIRATRDEYVPAAESDRLIALASEPKHAWTIAATDHRFSDNLPELDRALAEALTWMRQASH